MQIIAWHHPTDAAGAGIPSGTGVRKIQAILGEIQHIPLVPEMLVLCKHHHHNVLLRPNQHTLAVEAYG
jgi:hypothetical protein